jgi:signal transduction histidine kinase
MDRRGNGLDVERSRAGLHPAGKGELAPPPRSLLLKLALFAATVVILTTAALSGAGYLFARDVLRDQIRERLRVVAVDRGELLENYVSLQQGRVALVSGRVRLLGYLEDFADGDIDEDLFRVETERILWDVQWSTTGFSEIWITDSEGNVVTATNEEYLGQNFAEDPDFEAGRTRRHLGVPRLIDGRYFAYLTGPAVTREGRFLGVAMVLLDVAPLVALLADTTGLGETGEVQVGTRVNDQVRYLLPSARDATRVVPAESVPPMVEAIEGRPGSGIGEYEGVTVLAAYRPVAYQPPELRPWGLVARMDVAEAHAPVARLRDLMLALLAGLLIAGVAASYWLARRFTRPIVQVTDAATIIASGDLSARVPVESDDEIGALAAAFNDMTGKLAHSYATLEERVVARTKELSDANAQLQHEIDERRRAEAQLAEARDEAEAASRAKSAFLANMSHEIRTPMNAIIGMTELVLDTPLTRSQREYLKMVQESGESLLSVINDILDFSKIEAGRFELERETFDLHEFLGDALKALALPAHRKGLELAFHVDPDVPVAVAGDRFRLRQVVLNLVGNALKFTERGEVVLHVVGESHYEAHLARIRAAQPRSPFLPANRLSRCAWPRTLATTAGRSPQSFATRTTLLGWEPPCPMRSPPCFAAITT